MTILIIEDDTDIGALLKRGFVTEGYEVEVAQDEEAALKAATLLDNLEAVILDVMLPDGSGLSVCRSLRNAGHQEPIIMLSARSAVSDRTDGLLAGADDYVVKPFAFEELLARVRVQALRRDSQENAPRTIEAGPLRLDLETRTLELDGGRLRLTEREAELLSLLMRNQGRPLPRGDIFSALWAGHGGASLNVVDVYVGYLRHKMAEAFPDLGKMIVTVRGRGFMFTPPLEQDWPST